MEETADKSAILSSVSTNAEEGKVIKQNQWCLVRALSEQGLSKSAIARELGLDAKTVRKWLKQSWEPQRRCKRRALDQFEAFLRGRAPEVGYNGAVLLRELRASGYRGSYQVLARYIRPWRANAAPELTPTPRFETGPGEQAQVDWGSTGVWMESGLWRVHLFVMVLGYSRRIFAKGYLNERLDALLDGHAAAFAHFGGRTQRILYDNPRTIVLDKDEATGEVLWSPTFKDRMDFYGVHTQLCPYYRAQTKGKVESRVKYVKRNALAGRCFRDLEQLNDWLLEWCLTIADRRLHGTTHEAPADRFARDEAAALLPVNLRPAPMRERLEHRVVPRDLLVVVETNRYPVPVAWVGQQVAVRIEPERVELINPGGETLSYRRVEGRHQQARWQGAARSYRREELPAPSGPPHWDPHYRLGVGEVEARPLANYEALLGEVAR